MHKIPNFKAENIVTSSSPKADYQLKVTEKEYERMRCLKKRINKDSFIQIKKFCDKNNIDFLSTL